MYKARATPDRYTEWIVGGLRCVEDTAVGREAVWLRRAVSCTPDGVKIHPDYVKSPFSNPEGAKDYLTIKPGFLFSTLIQGRRFIRARQATFSHALSGS